MTRPIQPLANIERRIPEAGRIRIGEKTAKAMKSIDVLRFTSPHKELIDLLAAKYGGQAKPWNDPKANPPNQFEVKTTTKTVDVLLPPNSIDSWYELWTGGGRARQCDGVTVTMAGREQMEELPCVCAAKNRMECAPYTRLIVILPDLPFYGTWRLQTKGWNALHELPGMVDLVNSVASSQLTKAQLGVQARKSVVNGRTEHYVVPVITMSTTPNEIAAGHANLTALSAGASDMPALSAAPVDAPELVEPDDGILEAESFEVTPLMQRAWACADQFGMDRLRFWQAFMTSTDGDLARIEVGVYKIEQGQLEVLGYTVNGGIHVQKGPNA